jgi:peptide-methionine (S)-S-oxide reductase
MEKATFGADVSGAWKRLSGHSRVVSTLVGYCGGKTDNPTYQDVCTDTTGHAEVVEITFDPAQLPYEQLLETFWKLHDPTTPNRQGPDVGSQYRSVIFFHSPAQEAAARAANGSINPAEFRNPVVTQIVPAAPFYKAEDYHQRYLEKRGLASCHI